jgi:hypothetical protein
MQRLNATIMGTALCGLAATMFAFTVMAADPKSLEKICVIGGPDPEATIVAACTKLIDSDPVDQPIGQQYSQNNLMKADHFAARAFAYMLVPFNSQLVGNFVLYYKKLLPILTQPYKCILCVPT